MGGLPVVTLQDPSKLEYLDSAMLSLSKDMIVVVTLLIIFRDWRPEKCRISTAGPRAMNGHECYSFTVMGWHVYWFTGLRTCICMMAWSRISVYIVESWVYNGCNIGALGHSPQPIAKRSHFFPRSQQRARSLTPAAVCKPTWTCCFTYGLMTLKCRVWQWLVRI